MMNQPSGSYELTILLGLSFSAITDDLHRQLAKKGFDDVRPVHGFLFQRIAAKGATGNEIAEHLGVTKQAASQMIDYLEQHDYIERKPHPLDGRGKLVILTERGWSCIQTTEEIFISIEQRYADIVGEERMNMLKADLRSLVHTISDESSPLRFRPVW
ncbi:MarR family winged helix-turn-helix transcriptional regulator [Paenibacillus baimaensis]